MPKSLGQAILECSCPKCRSGQMFALKPTQKWFNTEMNTSCAVCHQTFQPEPGFYYGAMFVSYAFSVVITFVSVFVLYFFFNASSIWAYLLLIASLVLLLWPLMFRYSRSIFLHLFGGIRYDANQFN